MPILYLNELAPLRLAPGIIGRIVQAGSMIVAHILIVAGSVLPERAHVHEQVVNVIKGKLELSVERKVTCWCQGLQWCSSTDELSG
jgi:hypothetical protein